LKNTAYIGLNLIYQLIVFFCILYANTYINDHVVPNCLLWQNNQPRVDTVGLLGSTIIKTLVLMIQGGFFLLMAFIVNRSVISNGIIIKRTLKLQIIATTCFILILIWGSFDGYLW
jgi:hypothetical protein